MTARTEVVALLLATLPPDITILPYAREIDPPAQPTVMVRIDEVRPSPAGFGLQNYEFALVLIAAKTAPGPADDELDVLLDDVLHALGKPAIPVGVTWTSAKRATYNDTHPAYEVAISVTAVKE